MDCSYESSTRARCSDGIALADQGATQTTRGVMAAAGNLELVKVSKRYGASLAVDSVDLRVPAGAYCCLLGPSGCGKTSTLRMIAGHESATSGDILIGSDNVTEF